jgi:hypothetical protein
MDLSSLLNPLGSTVQLLSQMINSPNGAGMPQEGGWPFKCKVSGWMARTTVMNSLDVDAKYPLRFYNRILYTGWSCTSSGQGCLPVKEEGTSLRGALERNSTSRMKKDDDQKRFMGCHPYDLSDLQLRGLSAELNSEEHKLMGEIMEETTAPMVDKRVLQQISEFWVPCLSLESVNQKKPGLHAEGMKYVRVAAMETPGVPEYIPLILEAKGQLMSLTNSINLARPDSDGIVCSTCALGTGVHILIDVPDFSPAGNPRVSSGALDGDDVRAVGARKLTFIKSMKEAMVKIGWPGAEKLLNGT